MGKPYNIENYRGKTYGRLTVIDWYDGEVKGKRKKVRCSCACNNKKYGEFVTDLVSILSGNTKTCGCKSTPPIGTIFKNKRNLDYIIEDYVWCGKNDQEIRPRTKLKIRFLVTSFTTIADIKEVRNGSVKDLYHPGIAGVGFIGEGTYKSKGDDTVCYQTWLDMLKRCYSPKTERTLKDYKDVEVVGDWHNYQNFADWFYRNYVNGYVLDKDLRVKGSRLYSPETCTFVPQELNSFLTGGLKRGIHFNVGKGRWVAQCQDGELTTSGKKKQTYLGSFKNEDEALLAYKNFKKGKLDRLQKQFPDVTEDIYNNVRDFIEELK